jgi:hypothetical protein
MKSIKTSILGLLLVVSTTLMAQANMEDVVYLKNGTVYKGMVIEQILGESLKVKIAGGSVIALQVSEVYKITKEPAEVVPSAAPQSDYFGSYGYHHYRRDTSTTPAYLRPRRFFGTIEFRPGINNIGLRVVRGYKFNRFASIGLGLGVDGVYFGKGISWGKGVYDNKHVNNGLYIPLYLQLSGDFLAKRITPYYYAEAGYGFHPANPFVDKNPISKSWGGPTGALGLGVKFYSKRNMSFAINANGNYRTDIYRTERVKFDPIGNPIKYNERGIAGKFFGTLGLAIGF